MYKATLQDRSCVVNILHSAFEPIKIPNSINYVVKQDKKRRKRLRILMEYLFDTSFLFGEVFLSDNRKACILVQFPHKKKVTLKTIKWDLRLAFKCIGFSNIFKVLKRELALKKYHIKDPHIHPIIMAANHEDKGKGFGVRLIMELKKYYENNKLPIIIETTTKENLKLYNKFGFKIFKETHDLDYPLFFLKRY